jgi:hypothetical protein
MRINLFLICTTPIYLMGCAAAPFFSSTFSFVTTSTFVQTTAINGVSYTTTGKGVSEHVVSGVADQDCKLYNIIDGKQICQDYQIGKIPQRDLTTRFTTGTPNSVEDVIEMHTKQ